ncbi:MAG: hypothetical protein U1E70_24730 [Acetobacteraceae bacterium]|nr:hypothetical protein [Pseudomonadota bacterium]
MQTLTQLNDVELDQVTGGLALSGSLFTGIKFNTAQSNQSGANVGLVTILTVQNVSQSSNIAQS